ncbi:hypothetical protein [Sphingomonas sp.]|uniref:hypothetical protein n=1 Tax=Sphingomonas sp. TaxID=28214 RepID=UPI001824865F|nr:hypothetical protein [Sphingomonas sp.]MBA3511084.1 hypothetical protein [Sphingomonas sp.]
MPAGLSLAIALLVGVAAAEPTDAGPEPGQAANNSQPAAKAANGCGPAPAAIEPGEIFVCAPRPQGYRIDPDVLEADRAKRRGKLKRPDRMVDNSCASVGPMGCAGMGGAGIDLLGAAMVLGTMATKAIRGENVGKMFITRPEPTEYELYQEAKRAREAKEAEAAAAAKAKAALDSKTEPQP